MTWLAALFLLGAMPPQQPDASQATGPVKALVFRLEHTGMPVPLYVVQVGADGQGAYWAGTEEMSAPATGAVKKITVSPENVKLLFAAVPVVNSGHCETKAKHIAQTGHKTLLVMDPGRGPSCDFNYSDDDALNVAANTFQAIAGTLETGERLEHMLRYDRLGLDAEMDNLSASLKERQALEVQNIAPVLQQIAQDDRVMERVRRKAARLLQDAPGVSTASAR